MPQGLTLGLFARCNGRWYERNDERYIVKRRLLRTLVMAVMVAASLAPFVVSAESPREASQGETPPFDPCGVSGPDGVSRNFPQTGGWDVNGSFLT